MKMHLLEGSRNRGLALWELERESSPSPCKLNDGSQYHKTCAVEARTPQHAICFR